MRLLVLTTSLHAFFYLFGDAHASKLACAAALKQANPSATMGQIEARIKAAPTRVSTARNGSISYPFLDCVAALAPLFANGFE